jgi:tetratricopeptide (TPR) repeat protein
LSIFGCDGSLSGISTSTESKLSNDQPSANDAHMLPQKGGFHMFGKPPTTVPDGLTAEQYYELAVWYEENRFFANARDATKRSLALQPDAAIAAECKRMLNVRLPACDVPKEAIDSFMMAEAQARIHPAAAIAVAEKLIADHPGFDWAHQLLAECHLRQFDIANCLQSVQTALKLHPDWPAALRLTAQALIVDMEYPSARSYLQKALAVAPQDEESRRLWQNLEFISSMEDTN